ERLTGHVGCMGCQRSSGGIVEWLRWVVDLDLLRKAFIRRARYGPAEECRWAGRIVKTCIGVCTRARNDWHRSDLQLGWAAAIGGVAGACRAALRAKRGPQRMDDQLQWYDYA